MTAPENLRHHGDEVMVFDAKGNYDARGKIVGIYRCDPPQYDVQPNRTQDFSDQLRGIPESRLRSVGRPYLAYERKLPPRVRHILDEA